MKKLMYRIGYYLLRMKAFFNGESVVYMGKDFFRVGYGLYEIKGMGYKKIFSHDGKIELMFDHYFIIGEDSIYDLSDGENIIFDNAKIIPNTVGWIINDKQYDINLEQLIDEDVLALVYNHIITHRKGKKGVVYDVYTYDGEHVHQFQSSKFKPRTEEDGDFFDIVVGDQRKKLHKLGLSNQVGELK